LRNEARHDASAARGDRKLHRDGEQTKPGHMKWATPGGRTYDTGPTRYEI
jgi:hypothetical protein